VFVVWSVSVVFWFGGGEGGSLLNSFFGPSGLGWGEK